MLIATLATFTILTLIAVAVVHVNRQIEARLRADQLREMRRENRFMYGRPVESERPYRLIRVNPGESATELARLHGGTILFVDDHDRGEHRHYIKVPIDQTTPTPRHP